MNQASKKLGAYKKQDLFGGWTRIDLLLQLYDRAISTVADSGKAHSNDDHTAFAKHFMDAQKTILAIHSGLKPDEHEVAFNVARLLHFVLECLASKNFGDALKVLESMRDGFTAIASEANELEQTGEISPMETTDVYQAQV